ncbi:NAD/NADP-dependent octopine/nopaline dehydrogenase family protein [Prevotella sp. HUN102]|uniref:NAD/NADP-dependent octopine/nopaline dehydrogenase family protein n=1 Tax=Prevotella sp. HUN102 TaxID=1392486 RepID=UPI00048C52C3|nr:NAD/NADP-dependent octopine/nopaline dehydrogenase family protein [Prevotella sp. HUN102]
MNIAIIGAGNGGQAFAGYLSSHGHNVSVWDRDAEKIATLKRKKEIEYVGCIEGKGSPKLYTTNYREAIYDAEIIMVTTIANAHEEVAENIAPYLQDNQIIILNPGRTCGALVFKQALAKNGCQKKYYLAEAQTLVYACRIIKDGYVNIIGKKDEVYLCALPSSETEYILKKIKPIYPCFKSVPNILYTGLENVGAMFHPCVCLFNAATIERQDEFWFYRDMTDKVAAFIEKFDRERIEIGKAYGINLISVNEWIKVAYNNVSGKTLRERMKNNPAYYDIKGPGNIFTRQLTEDIPTGVLPILELGKVANVSTPLLESMVTIIENLLEIDFNINGRTLKKLGLDGMSKNEILNYITNGN